MQSGDQYLDHATYDVPSSLHHAIPLESQSMNAPVTGSLADDYPSDPHDFYRQYNPQIDDRPGIVVGTSADTMASAQQRARRRINGLSPSPASSLGAARSSVRSASDPQSTNNSALGAARSFPPVSTVPRAQRPSVKDRVNQFQQRAASTGGPASGRSGKPRPSVGPASVTPSAGGPSSSIAATGAKAAPVQQSAVSNRNLHTVTVPGNNGSAAGGHSSSTSIHSDVKPEASASRSTGGGTSGRTLLFGEVDGLGSHNVGYGIPNRTQYRRGSEGSMHWPNAMFSPSDGHSELDDIRTSSGLYSLAPAPPRATSAQGHRRAQSDNASATSFRNRNRSMGRINAGPIPYVQPAVSSNAHTQRSPPSKIPIKTRGPYATPTSSPLERGPVPFRDNAGKENHNRQRPVTPPLTLSAKRYQPTSSKPASSNQSLKAIITAPAPKKSPPLRSSRPRQPVSTASTAASRARAAERSGSPSQHRPDAQDTSTIKKNTSKAKWISDFGTVNVAARTAQLQRVMVNTRRGSTEARSPTEGSNSDQSQLGAAEESSRMLPKRPRQATLTDGRGTPPTTDGFTSPAPRLALNINDLPVSDGLEPSSGVTVFETDDSPVIGLASPFKPVTTSLSRAVGSQHEHAPAGDAVLEAEPTPATLGEAVYDQHVQPFKTAGAGLGAIVSIMRASSPSNASNADIVEDATSERDDGESIQIGLGATPVESYEQWQSRRIDDYATPSAHDAEKRFTNGSLEYSTPPETSIAHRIMEPFPDHLDARSSLMPDDSVSIAHGGKSSEQSPDTPYAPRGRHFTLNSEARSAINKVLDHYHSGVVTPQMAHEFQQQIEAMTPELARHEGWDSIAATQLYLQNLLNAQLVLQDVQPQRSERENKPARTHSDPYNLIQDSPEDEDYHGTAIIYGRPEAYDHSTVGDANVDVAEAQHGHSASTSTLHTARPDTDSGFIDEEYRPTPPPKDWKFSPRPADSAIATSEGALEEGEDTPKVQVEGRPRLPEIESISGALGLAIDVSSLQASPALSPPPLPTHSPPPPPAAQIVDRLSQGPMEIRSMPSPSIYTRNPPVSSFSSALPEDATDRVRPYHTSGGIDDREKAIVTSKDTSAGAESESAPPNDSHSNALERQPSPASVDKQKLSKDLVERKNVIRELVDTEYSFGVDMTVLEDIYKATSVDISNLGDILTDDDRRLIFGNSDKVKMFSRDFLNDLKKGAAPVYKIPRSSRWGSNKRESSVTSQSGSIELTDEERNEQDRDTRIGEKFRMHLSTMEEIFGDYIKGRDAGNERLEALQSQPNVALWLAECKNTAQDLTGAWDLDSILVKPAQRIMKYPLLLDNLLKCTPSDHPDYEDLSIAAKEIKRVNERINETKRRHDIVDQLSSRKRKDTEPNKMPIRLLHRKAERIKQQVGLFSAAEDQEYEAIAQKFGGHFFQLQIVTRDVEKYVEDVQRTVEAYKRFVDSLQDMMDVETRTDYTQTFSTWSKYAQNVREISDIALPDHINAIREKVIRPIMTLWKLHDKPQRLMQKRKKRIVDYARWKDMKTKGLNPEKKLERDAAQFEAVNDTLKIELPKIYALTRKLIEAVLRVFISLQMRWQRMWELKTNWFVGGEQRYSKSLAQDVDKIVDAYMADSVEVLDEMNRMTILNKTALYEISSWLSPTTTFSNDDASSRKRPSTSNRTISLSSDPANMLNTYTPPDLSQRHSGSLAHSPLSGTFPHMDSQPQPSYMGRNRASSALSSRGPSTPRSFSGNAPGNSYFPQRPSTSTATATGRMSLDSARAPRPHSGSNYLSVDQARPGAYSPGSRSSAVFQSALPMADSPISTRPETPQETEEPKVMFLAASLFEFNIDASRTEGGYPYLRYVPGEIFDVIGQKGELWLARNQDDASKTPGWIWEKHFARISPDET